MRQPTQQKPRGRQQVSSLMSYPAPIGGLNAVDSLAAMAPTDALALTNWYPRANYVEIRGGSSSHATGMTGNGKTLAVHNGLNGTNKLFCATNAGVYDVSSAGAVGASVAARTNGKHQWLMFGDGTNNWLIMVNGADKPLYFDGTNWIEVDGASSPALTGLTTTSIIGVAVHKGRLIFIEKDSLSFWYLAAGAAGGALTEFPLDGVAQRGGYLMAAMSWTVDSGSGPDDRMVFITSEGELIIYQGTNPNSPNTWALVGVYQIGKPLGRRCTIKVGSDLALLTQNGVYSLGTVLNESGVNSALAVSRKIEPLMNADARSYGDNFGWSMTLLPAQEAFIVNVPQSEDGTHHQYVMNTVTKAWCKFTGWDAEDFAVYNDALYYCDGTSVIAAWTGTGDQDANISAYAKTAFSYFGRQTQLKLFKLFRPVLAVDGNIAFLIDIDVDFDDDNITGSASYSVSSGAVWDASNWDESYWSSGLEIVKDWFTAAEWQGYCAAGKIKIDTNSLSVRWMSADYVFELGGVL
jgi:hypothetical protein